MTREAYYQQNRSLADTTFPIVQRIITLCLPHLVSLHISDEDEDRTGYDCILTLKSPALRIAVRVRRHQYCHYATREITIRYPSEYTKMHHGSTDLMLYGCLTPNQHELQPWHLIDIQRMRQANLFHPSRATNGQWMRKQNKDNTQFVVIPLAAVRQANAYITGG